MADFLIMRFSGAGPHSSGHHSGFFIPKNEEPGFSQWLLIIPSRVRGTDTAQVKIQ